MTVMTARATIAGKQYLYPSGPAYPGLKVYFRPDEVIARLGTSRDKTITPAHLYDYLFEVFRDGVLFQSKSYKNHWWASDKLVEINPDLIIRDQNTLRALDLVPPIADPGMPVVKDSGVGFDDLAGTATGITMYEGTTGERPDIGVLNGWFATWLLGGAASDFLTAARANRAMPVWWPDENTGTCFNLINDISASTYSSPGANPWMGPWAPGQPWDPPEARSCPWLPDGAHAMENAYGAYVATGMLRHLEALQYRVTQMFMEDPYWSGLAGVAVFAPSQTRKSGWTARGLAMAARATQLAESLGALPKYLLPYSYWKSLLDKQFAWIRKTYMENPVCQTFRAWPICTTPGWWQQEYVNISLGLAAMWWPQDYGDFYIWSLGSVMGRTSGDNGWPPAYPSWYYGALGPSLTNQSPNPPDALDPSRLYKGWGECWEGFAAGQLAGTDPNPGQLTQAEYDALKRDPYNGGAFAINEFAQYNSTVRGSLAFAVYLDRKKNPALNISAVWQKLEQCYAKQDAMVKDSGYMPARWSIAVDPQPITLPPPPDPDPVPPPADFPITVHGIVLRAEQILALVMAKK